MKINVKRFQCLWSLYPFLFASIVCLGLVLAASPANATVCNPSTYGVNPGTVNPSSFQTMLTSCAAKTIQFAAGTYTFAPSGVAAGFTVPGGTTAAPTVLLGNGATGAAATIFQVANSGTYEFLLRILNVSNVSIQAIQFRGSTYPAACTVQFQGYGNVIGIQSAAGASSSVENISIQNNSFINFNGTQWIGLTAADQSPGIGAQTELPFSGNTFDSTSYNPGNCVDTAGTADSIIPVYMISLYGSTLSTVGRIGNVSVASNTFYADHVKGAVAIWQNAYRVSVQYNTIANAGRQVLPTSGWTAEQARYAIIAYNWSHNDNYNGALWPNTVWIVGNTITNPVSAGVYIAAAKNFQISHNAISGQTDTLQVNIPKGAIALNSLINPTDSATTWIVDHNTLNGNYAGLSYAGATARSESNNISVPPNGFGVQVWPTATTSAIINNTTITTTATDGSATSVIGFAYASLCVPIAAGGASITNLTQIGWTATSSNPRSLSWYDQQHSCLYHHFTDAGVAVSGATRQATSTSTPVPQTVFWPYLN